MADQEKKHPEGASKTQGSKPTAEPTKSAEGSKQHKEDKETPKTPCCC
jgi:hypothetical protein